MTKTYIDINGDVRDTSTLTLPQDRTFRAAWEFNGDVVEVDMASAKAIHKDNLRIERSARWGGLDTAFMKALESGDMPAQAAIGGVKQALRDVTSDARIDAATTPDELKALALATLLGE